MKGKVFILTYQRIKIEKNPNLCSLIQVQRAAPSPDTIPSSEGKAR